MPEENAPNVTIIINKDGEAKSQSVDFDNDGTQNFQKLYLESGPGFYTIKIESNFYESDGTSEAEEKEVSLSLGELRVSNKDSRDLSFLFPSVKVQSDNPEIKILAAKITSGINDPLSKAKAIHDWVTKNIFYDVVEGRNVEANNLYITKRIKTAGTTYPISQSALLTLQRRKGTCEGYAELVAALNRAVGIPTKIVTGVAGQDYQSRGPHGWNEFLVGGKWLIEDATWDSTHERTFLHREKDSDFYFNTDPNDFYTDHEKIGFSDL